MDKAREVVYRNTVLTLAKRGIVEDEDTNLFPVTHQMRRVENWFSSAENMIGRSRNWNRNSIKNDQAEREFRREAAKKDKGYKVNEKRRKPGSQGRWRLR